MNAYLQVNMNRMQGTNKLHTVDPCEWHFADEHFPANSGRIRNFKAMNVRSILFLLFWAVFPLVFFAQMTHEGETNDRLKIGRHVWKDQNDQIKAEVVYDASGVVLSFRTWDEKGLLIDDIRMDAKRKRNEFPPMNLTMEQDGFGFQLIAGQAQANAPAPRQGERVGVFYEGCLQDGTVFDGNFGAKKPFRFKFQMGEVVKGFDRAVEMLKVGQEGYFWIPAELAYGPNVAGEIPPFSDLLFRIKLVDLN